MSFVGPKHLSDQPVIICKAIRDVYRKDFCFCNIIELEVDHRIWCACFGVFDFSDFWVILFSRFRYCTTWAGQEEFHRIFRYFRLIRGEEGDKLAII